MNKKYIWALVVVVVVIVVFGISRNFQTKGTIKIGGAYNITGPVASMGELQVKGTQIAVDEINKNGGIGGKKLEFVTEDTASDAKQSVSAYEALKLKGVKYVIAETSAVVSALRPIIIADKNILFTPGSITPSYFDNNGLSCRIALTANNFGPGFAEIANKKGYKRIITLLPNNEYGKGLLETFSKPFVASGGQVVLSEFYLVTPGAGDYRTNLSKIKNLQNNADAIVLVNVSTTVEPMLRQIKELGITLPIITDTYTVNNTALKDFSLTEGMSLVDYGYIGGIDASDSPEVVKFKKDYKEKFGSDPAYEAAAHYDTIKILAEAIGKVGDDPVKVSDYITKMKDYRAITGTFSFNNDCEVDRPIFLREILGGQVNLMK